MAKAKFIAIVAVGGFIEALFVLPWIASARDPVGPIGLSLLLFFIIFMTAAVASVPDGNGSYGRAGRQKPGYQQLNEYFNQQAMRRDLDQIAQTAVRMETQAQFDRLNK